MKSRLCAHECLPGRCQGGSGIYWRQVISVHVLGSLSKLFRRNSLLSPPPLGECPGIADSYACSSQASLWMGEANCFRLWVEVRRETLSWMSWSSGTTCTGRDLQLQVGGPGRESKARLINTDCKGTGKSCRDWRLWPKDKTLSRIWAPSNHVTFISLSAQLFAPLFPLPPRPLHFSIQFKQNRPWVSCFWNVTENSLLRKAYFP